MKTYKMVNNSVNTISTTIRTERRLILFLSRNEINVTKVRIDGITSSNPYLKTVGFMVVSPPESVVCGLDIVAAVIPW